MYRKFKEVVLGLLAHVTPAITPTTKTSSEYLVFVIFHTFAHSSRWRRKLWQGLLIIHHPQMKFWNLLWSWVHKIPANRSLTTPKSLLSTVSACFAFSELTLVSLEMASLLLGTTEALGSFEPQTWQKFEFGRKSVLPHLGHSISWSVHYFERNQNRFHGVRWLLDWNEWMINNKFT